MSSQELQLSAKDLHKMEPIAVHHGWGGAHEAPPLSEEL